MRRATQRLLEDGHRYGAAYRGGLANHLPMALVALEGLGADDTVIARFRESYARQLQPLVRSGSAEAPGEPGAGARQDFPRWLAFFERRIAEEGAAVVLRQWVDRLLPGVAGAAFHGAIRTGYAVEVGHDAELAHGLGYWASTYMALPGSTTMAGRLSPPEVLGAISTDPRLAGRRPDGAFNIAQLTAGAAATDACAEHIAATDPGAVCVDSVARAMLQAYAATNDFTLLHGVTGCHALRLILPYSADRTAAVAHFWRAAAAAYIGCGSPPLLRADPSRMGWDEIQARAVASTDEHDIKLVYSCWREWQHRGDDLYRQAAAARVASLDRLTA